MTGPEKPADELAEKLERTELQHKPSSIPGREIVQVVPVESVGRRWRRYILAGTVEMRIKGQPTLTLHAGDHS